MPGVGSETRWSHNVMQCCYHELTCHHPVADGQPPPGSLTAPLHPLLTGRTTQIILKAAIHDIVSKATIHDTVSKATIHDICIVE